MFRSKKDIWKSLLYSLLTTNIIMVVIWAIMSAFGYQPHYLMSFVIHNAMALLFWFFRVFEGDW
jgi:hypothetical protein